MCAKDTEKRKKENQAASKTSPTLHISTTSDEGKQENALQEPEHQVKHFQVVLFSRKRASSVDRDRQCQH